MLTNGEKYSSRDASPLETTKIQIARRMEERCEDACSKVAGRVGGRQVNA